MAAAAAAGAVVASLGMPWVWLGNVAEAPLLLEETMPCPHPAWEVDDRKVSPIRLQENALRVGKFIVPLDNSRRDVRIERFRLAEPGVAIDTYALVEPLDWEPRWRRP